MNYNYHSQRISKHIKDMLEKRGMTKGELADKLKVQKSIVTRWVSGNHNFTLKTIEKIEGALNCKLMDSSKEGLLLTEYHEQTKNLSCSLCGYFCNNVHHHNNWFDTTVPLSPAEPPAGEGKGERER